MYKELCDRCKEKVSAPQQNDKQKKEQKRASSISAGFLNQLSLELRFSFQAISLLVDCAVLKKASLFQFKIARIEEPENHDHTEQNYEQNYMEVKFNCPLTRSEVFKFCQGQIQDNNLSTSMKLGILGLGKTGVVISNDGRDQSVIVFSVDDRINYKFYQNSEAMFYIEDIHSKAIKNMSGHIQKVIILQAFKIFHLSLEKILNCESGSTKIFIFHPRIFVMSNKIMFYEISESNFGRDIDTYHNPDKIQLLNKIGYEMSTHAEVRLSSYLSLLYTSNVIKFKIAGNDETLQFANYLDYLRLLEKNGMVVKVPTIKIFGTTFIEIYEAKNNYFAQNNGILLYFKGRMINRHGTEFGTMMDDCFFKKKYKKPARNIWKFLGVIQMSEQIVRPNIVKTKFISNIYYHKFIKDLRLLFKKLQKRNPTIMIGDDSEQNRSIRQGSLGAESCEESEPKKKFKQNPEGQRDT